MFMIGPLHCKITFLMEKADSQIFFCLGACMFAFRFSAQMLKNDETLKKIITDCFQPWWFWYAALYGKKVVLGKHWLSKVKLGDQYHSKQIEAKSEFLTKYDKHKLIYSKYSRVSNKRRVLNKHSLVNFYQN